MPGNAKSHDACRADICCICELKASSMVEVKPGVTLDRIKRHYPKFDLTNQKQPKGICARDRKLLIEIEQGKKKKEVLPTPTFYDSNLDFGGLTGRQLQDKTDCWCSLICSKVRSAQGGTLGNTANEKPYSIGRPGPPPRPKSDPLCFDCLAPKAVGKPHRCNLSMFRKNADELLSARDPAGREMLAAKVYREKAAAAPTGSNIELKTGGGKTVTIPGRPSTSKAPYAGQPIPAEEVRKLATACNLSNNQLDRFGTGIRALSGRHAFEPYTASKVRWMDRTLDSFYKTKRVKVHPSNPNEEGQDENGMVWRTLFYCDEVPDLADYIEDKRGYHSQTETFKKVGFDFGGTWLKLCLNLEKIQDALASPSRKSRRSSYSDGVLPKLFKDSGVKKLIPLAMIQHCKESYENLATIVNEVGLNRIDYTPAFDMKLGLTFMGMGTAASTCPCLWCELPKKLFSNPTFLFKGGTLRTLKDIQDQAEAYLAACQAHKGARKLSSAEFKSCEKYPLFEPDVPDRVALLHKFIVEMIPPMELHMLLGLGNDLFKVLEATMEALNMGESLKRWLKMIGAEQSHYFGGQFNGNNVENVLRGVNSLRNLLSRDLKKSQKLQDILKAMETLEAVKHCCFGQDLDPRFEKEIQLLGKLWLRIGMSVTPKAHALFVHVSQFLHFKNPQTGPKRGLGYWSEQASESVHHDFERHWQQGYKRPLDSPDYDLKALQCISTYAARHI